MQLRPDQDLLHYRLVAKIGEGGMGVVWKARDTSLGRDAAIKVIPEIFASDADRLARFEREARLLASLNHPNIAAVYGLHEVDGMRFIAFEYIEGEDLAARLARGRIPVDECLAIAVQVAAALEAAHARGVIHRDLKPANIVLTPEGQAKVLDFGLAKAIDPGTASGGADASLSPTLTSAGTVAGVILGTAAYMSPEQARGKPVDRRSDLWSFGCVLHECLTGTQVFRGETVSDSLAAILRKDPDWSRLPAGTPPEVRALVRRCLTRDPTRRQQDAGDARIALQEAVDEPRADGSEAPATPRRLSWAAMLVMAAVTVLAVLFAISERSTVSGSTESLRLTIPVPDGAEFGALEVAPPVISPDGRAVVFGAIDDGGGADGSRTRLWLRTLSDFEATALPETSGANHPFFSPDGRHLAYFRGGLLRRLELATGHSQAIDGSDWSTSRGGSWNASGQIIFSPHSNAGIYVIDASGGQARPVTTLDPTIPDCSHRWPVFLPDGDHFIFLLWTNDLAAQAEHGGVYVASLSGREEPRKLVPEASSAVYAPPGYLLAVRESDLLAVPFDVERLEVTGGAEVVATGVLRDRASGYSFFSVSREGTLVFAGGRAFRPSTLTWYDRAGNAEPGSLAPAAYVDLRLGPGGTHAVASIIGTSDTEIWTLDLVRGVRTRLAHGPSAYNTPVLSADGSRVMFTTQEESENLYVRPTDGSGTVDPVIVDDVDKSLYDWSMDGDSIVYWPIRPGSATPDLWIHSIKDRRSDPFLQGPVSYRDARFSSDGRWIAYVSDESGQPEIFVQGIDRSDGIRPGSRWRVSTAGGEVPHWRDDGREIVYIDSAGKIMSVSVESQNGGLALGAPRELFAPQGRIMALDATGDHERFLVASRDEARPEPLRVILNWVPRSAGGGS